MSKKLKTFFGVLVLIGGMILIYKDIFDLWNKEDLHTVRVDYAIEVLEVSHRLNVIIPIGKDYYFLALQENGSGIDGYVIRANGKWQDANFNADHLALTENGVEVTALSKETERKYQSLIHSKVQKMEEILETDIRFPLGEDHFLEMGYRWKAIFKLVTLVLILLEVVAGVVIVKRGSRPGPVATVFGISCVITVLLFLATILISL